MRSICLVTCYFGSWPKYMDLFLKTCRHNPTIDFILFSDCGRLARAPDNVRIVPTTLEEIRVRAQDKLKVEPAIPTPYHLCDFKPTYGLLFEDYLARYDFWGCTDLDLIYGNIRSFITEELLTDNDVISAQKSYLTGYFFLFRNQDQFNTLFRKSRDSTRVFETGELLGFDECSHCWQELDAGASIQRLDTQIESMTEIIRREEDRGDVRAHFSYLGRETIAGSTFTWENGRLYEDEENCLLLHFVLMKDIFYFMFPDWDEIPSRFHVTSTGFYRDGETTGLEYLRALPTGPIVSGWCNQVWRKCKRRLPWLGE